MDVEAERLRYEDAASVVPTGQLVFREPKVLQCIQDSLSSGQEGFWSLLVDIIPYTEALAKARGASPEDAIEEARVKYLTALAAFDVDGFEASLFWETYLDEKYIQENPYELSAAAPEDGWDGSYQ